jgi:hypothetical protein
MDPVSIVLIAGGVAGALLTIYHLAKAVLSGARKFFRAVDQVEFIFHEVRPNSGSSMKDQVNRVEDGLEKVNTRVDQAIAAIKELFDEHLSQHLTDREAAHSEHQAVVAQNVRDRTLATADHQEVMDISSPSIKKTPTL